MSIEFRNQPIITKPEVKIEKKKTESLKVDGTSEITQPITTPSTTDVYTEDLSGEVSTGVLNAEVNTDRANEAIELGLAEDGYDKEITFPIDKKVETATVPEEKLETFSNIYNFETKTSTNKVINDEMKALTQGLGTGKTLSDLGISEADLNTFINEPNKPLPPSILALQDKLKSQGSWTAQATLTHLTKIRLEVNNLNLKKLEEKIVVLKVKSTLSPQDKALLQGYEKQKTELSSTIKSDKETLSSIADRSSKIRLANNSTAISALKAKMDAIPDKNSAEYKALKASLTQVYKKSETEVKQVTDYALQANNGKPAPNEVVSTLNASVARMGLTIAKIESNSEAKSRNPLLTTQAPDAVKDLSGGAGYYINNAIEFGKENDPQLLSLRISYSEQRNDETRTILKNSGVEINDSGFEFSKELQTEEVALMKDFINDTQAISDDAGTAIIQIEKKIKEKTANKAGVGEVVDLYKEVDGLYDKKRDSELTLGNIDKQRDSIAQKVKALQKTNTALLKEGEQIHSEKTIEGLPTERGKLEKEYSEIINKIREDKEKLADLKSNPEKIVTTKEGAETISREGEITALEASLAESEKVKKHLLTTFERQDKRYDQLTSESGVDSTKGNEKEINKLILVKAGLKQVKSDFGDHEVNRHANEFKRTINDQKQMYRETPAYIKQSPQFKKLTTSTNLLLADDINRGSSLLAYTYAKAQKEDVAYDKEAQKEARAKAQKTIEEQYNKLGRSVPDTKEVREQLSKLTAQNLEARGEEVFNQVEVEKKNDISESALASFKKAVETRTELRTVIPPKELEAMAVQEVFTGNNLAVSLADKNPSAARNIIDNNVKVINTDVKDEKAKRVLKVSILEASVEASFASRKAMPPQLTGASSALIKTAEDLYTETKDYKELAPTKKVSIGKDIEDFKNVHTQEISAMKDYLVELKAEAGNVDAYLKYKKEKLDGEVFGEHKVAIGWMFLRSVAYEGEIDFNAFANPLEIYKQTLDIHYTYKNRIADLESFIDDYEKHDKPEIFIERSREAFYSSGDKKNTDVALSRFLETGLEKELTFTKIAQDNAKRNGTLGNLEVNVLRDIETMSMNVGNLKLTDVSGVDTNEFTTHSEVLDKTLAVLNKTDTAYMLAEIAAMELATAGLASGMSAVRASKFVAELVTKYPSIEKAIALSKTLYNLAPNIAKRINPIEGISAELKNIIGIFKTSGRAAELAGIRNVGTLALEVEKLSKVQTFVHTAVSMSQVVLLQQKMNEAAKAHFGPDSAYTKAIEKFGQFLFVSSTDTLSGLDDLASKVALNFGTSLGQQFAGIVTEQLYKDLVFGADYKMTEEDKKRVQSTVELVSMAVGVVLPSIVATKQAHGQESRVKTEEQLSVLLKDVETSLPKADIKALKSALQEYNLSNADPKYNATASSEKLVSFKKNIDSLLSDKTISTDTKAKIKETSDILIRQETLQLALKDMPKIETSNPIEYGNKIREQLQKFNPKEHGLAEFTTKEIETIVTQKTMEKALQGVQIIKPEELAIAGKDKVELTKVATTLQDKLAIQKKELTEKLKECLKYNEAYKDPEVRDKAIESLVKIAQKASFEKLLETVEVSNGTELHAILDAYKKATGSTEGLNIKLKRDDTTVEATVKVNKRGNLEFQVVGANKAEIIKPEHAVINNKKGTFEFTSTIKPKEEFTAIEKEFGSIEKVNEFLSQNNSDPAKMLEFYNKFGWDNIRGLSDKIDKTNFDKIHEVRDNKLKETWEKVATKAKKELGVELENPYVGTPPTDPKYKKAYSDLDFAMKIKSKDGKEVSLAERLKLEIEVTHMFLEALKDFTPASGATLDVNVYPTLKPVPIAMEGQTASPELLKIDKARQLDTDFYQARVGCGTSEAGNKAWSALKKETIAKAEKQAKKDGGKTNVEALKRKFELAESKFNKYNSEVETISKRLKIENPNYNPKVIDEMARTEIRIQKEMDLYHFVKDNEKVLESPDMEGQIARLELSRLQLEVRSVLPEAYISHAGAEWGAAGDKVAQDKVLSAMSPEDQLRGRVSQQQYILHWIADVADTKGFESKAWKASKYDLRDMDFLSKRFGTQVRDDNNTIDIAIMDVKAHAKTPTEAKDIWVKHFGTVEKAEDAMNEYLDVLEFSSQSFLSNYFTKNMRE